MLRIMMAQGDQSLSIGQMEKALTVIRYLSSLNLPQGSLVIVFRSMLVYDLRFTGAAQNPSTSASSTSATQEQEPAISTPVSNKPGESSGKCGVLILLGHCNTMIKPFEESSRLSAY